MKSQSRSGRIDREAGGVTGPDAGRGQGPKRTPPRSGVDFLDRGLPAPPPGSRPPASAQIRRHGPAVVGPGRQRPTPLPSRLRSGIESVSGVDLADVQVHANSPSPARLHALAFAHGNQIHLGPGQERRLPHEAWHVVQQRQGRVRPTAQTGGVRINDDPALEREADRWGAQAASQAVPVRPDPAAASSEAAPDQRASTAPGAAPAAPCVQRAIGFEFEVKDWHVRHIDDKSKLAKGIEPVVEQDGVDLTADDDGDRSDIEWVTGALETRDEVLYAVDQARDLALAMQKRQDDGPLPASDFDYFGHPHRNAEFLPGKTMNATMQATIGVPLGDLPALYRALAEADGPAAEKAQTTLTRANRAGLLSYGKPTADLPPAPPIPVEQMSAALKGFLLAVIDYLRTGFSGDAARLPHEQFPKGKLNLLAKTSFKKMFDLVKDEAKLTEAEAKDAGLVLRQEWIDWIIQAAIPGTTGENLEAKRQRRVLDFEYGISNIEEGRDEPAYTIEVSRQEWLRSLPSEDRLRHDNPDTRVNRVRREQDPPFPAEPLSEKLEGFAALGPRTDKLVTDVANKLAEQLVEVAEQDASLSSKGKEPADDPIVEQPKPKPSQTEAPVFEMRHLSTQGGDPASWPVNAMSAWQIYTDAIGDRIYRAGNRKELENLPQAYGDTRRPDLDPNLQGSGMRVDVMPTRELHPIVPDTAPVNPPARSRVGRLRAIWNALFRRR